MNKSILKLTSRTAVIILGIIGLIEFGLALWTVLDSRYKVLAYNLADVGYIVSVVQKRISWSFVFSIVY